MKVAVMSDNHGDDEQIEQVLAYEKNADVFIHCGDSEAYGPILDRFYAVRGNNDWFNPNLKNEITLNLEGHRIVVTHGHRAGYFGREAYFLSLAEEYAAKIVLCGHTHIPCHEVIDGIHIINPGSTRLPRGGSPACYCVLELTPETLQVTFKSIKDGKEVTIHR